MNLDLMYSGVAPFKIKGKKEMTISEFIFALSLDLKWFSPDQSRVVLEKAVKRGFIKQRDDTLEPGIDIDTVSIPPDFTPDFRKIMEITPFDIIVDRIVAKTGKDRKDIIAEINDKYEEYDRMLDASVIALVFAREMGIDVSDMVDEVCDYVFG